jgi:SAM-dependent methyltransferase
MAEHDTRQSWNIATRNHNAHKGDQARFFREGGDVLFPEELELIGTLEGRDVVHLQCNSGQDTLGLARRGAMVTGVDLSDEAIAFARRLSADSGIAASFVEAEVVGWLASTSERFDIVFTSYGATGWLPDLDAWAQGVARVLRPGGKFVYMEFHPLVWSLGEEGGLTGDDYFAPEPFCEPVGDYVALSGAGLGAEILGETVPNTVPAMSWQHGVGDIVTALCGAGLVLESLREYPYSNGFRKSPSWVAQPGRRYVLPEGVARVPLMFGIAARKSG